MADGTQIDNPSATQDSNPALVDAAVAPTVSFTDLKAAGLPETYIGPDGKLNTADLVKHLSDGNVLRTAAEERAKGVPADGKYDFGLPQDWTAPEELKASKETIESWKVSEGRQGVFAEVAKDLQLSQAQVAGIMSKLATADITEKVSEAKAVQDAHEAEMGKLGSSASDRLKAVDSYLTQNLGRDAAVALTRELTTAAGIEAVEKLIAAANRAPLAPVGDPHNPNPALVDPLTKLYPSMNQAR